MNAGVPPDFGGLLAWWDDDHLVLVRYGKGRVVEGISFTPLNALQAHQTLGQLIEIGKRDGVITEEHVRQSEQMRPTPLGDVMPRAQVDEIAGPD